MKDLYTFDATVAAAMETYEQVRGAYAAIFAELKVPVRVARASSGDMGGDLSHEYHLAASLGEDDVASCSTCGFAGNTEVVRIRVPPPARRRRRRRTAADDDTGGRQTTTASHGFRGAQAWRGIARDRSTLVSVWYPEAVVDAATGVETALTDDDIDVQAVREAVPDLDVGRRDAAALGRQVLEQATTRSRPRLVNLVDWRLLRDVDSADSADSALTTLTTAIDAGSWPSTATADVSTADIAATAVVDAAGQPFGFVRARTGDDCPDCGAAAALRVERAIELGHTFYLGTRYSAPLGLRVQGDGEGEAEGKAGSSTSTSTNTNTVTPLMGCYGFGVSRVLGAVADHLADAKGLCWPRAIAPFDVAVVVAGGSPLAAVAERVYDELAGTARDAREDRRVPAVPAVPADPADLDVLLDDRPLASLPYKLKDADLTGYPVVVVVGAAWRRSTSASAPSASAALAPPHHSSIINLDGLCEVQCRQLGVRQDVPLRDLKTFVSGLLAQL